MHAGISLFSLGSGKSPDKYDYYLDRLRCQCLSVQVINTIKVLHRGPCKSFYGLRGKHIHRMRGDKKNESATGGDDAVRFSPDRITSITVELAEKMKRTIDAIEKINTQSKILTVNAKVESARAGRAGDAFSVVANEMSTLSNEISELVKKLEKETQVEFQEIARLNEYFATNFRGTRLSDIALTNIDLVDRNLYERSCDVRWWATDQSIVDALENQTQQACQYASMRLGVILNSYTVYFDLVLCDCAGNVIANGRKRQISHCREKRE